MEFFIISDCRKPASGRRGYQDHVYFFSLGQTPNFVSVPCSLNFDDEKESVSD